MSNKKICVTCKAENEASFKYCRSCGAVLPTVDDATSKDEAVFEATSGFNSSAATIDGISEEHLRVYIGKNHHRILNSFFNMSQFIYFFQRPDPYELASDQLFQHILFCRKCKF